MQDIPRNELLDKLASGWKVRRKSWPESVYLHKNSRFKHSANLLDLVVNDWEGEPPKPVCSGKDLSIVKVFEMLRDGEAKFARRGAGITMIKLDFNHPTVTLSPRDIIANDWEVWG